MNNTDIIAIVIKECAKLCGANPTNKSIGKPNAIAGTVCIIRLFDAGVSNCGSTSLKSIVPVLAVPVSIPKSDAKAS